MATSALLLLELQPATRAYVDVRRSAPTPWWQRVWLVHALTPCSPRLLRVLQQLQRASGSVWCDIFIGFAPARTQPNVSACERLR